MTRESWVWRGTRSLRRWPPERHKHLGWSITALIPASSVYLYDMTRAELLRHLCWRAAPWTPGAASRPLIFLTSWHLTDNLTRRR
jgi:hypothetical protein